jgi:hypothetical protein
MTKVMTKRNAVIGWATWRLSKRVAKRKARGAIPAVEGGRPNPSAIATTAAALAGLAFFWRKRHRAGEPVEAA